MSLAWALASLLGTAADRHVAVVGAGWAGLSAAHHLAKQPGVRVTLIDAAPRVGGLVRDGYRTPGGREAEAGQHGFWAEYRNIFALIDELGLDSDGSLFSPLAEQGQWSPRGLEAVWPVLAAKPRLPTGVGQALWVRFLRLPPADLASLTPLFVALCELDGSEDGYAALDSIDFRTLCATLGVSARAYREVAEPMVLTGLFAAADTVSAAAALGMADFFVLRAQGSFDVRWCRGNVGARIFAPWERRLRTAGVDVRTGTRVRGLALRRAGDDDDGVRAGGAPSRRPAVRALALSDGTELAADAFVLALGAAALARLADGVPAELARTAEWRGLRRLRGTDCIATRLWLDRRVPLRFSANPARGFAPGVGSTFFDLSALHAPLHAAERGSVLEVDWYAAGGLLAESDAALIGRAKRLLDTVEPRCAAARVRDAAIVRLPSSATLFFPGSAEALPPTRSAVLDNVCFAADFVRSAHGSWSQERAYVSGMDAANAAAGRRIARPIPLPPSEPHFALGRAAAAAARSLRPVMSRRTPAWLGRMP
ncbi:hypothetical protein KFE25_009731 [Diacronema lutheri]|uniref:Amine oxidase domain-containing protein n=1 Tax=Diacronema lutheri TaxID=2081491 RepID=A0A8J5Y432_DIALT|nr:hypothetical protein KFE25_009731 [Diacronema lutheri]